jgi:beta-phosphoglucomutase-like phosphatase (HAD superfamily)
MPSKQVAVELAEFLDSERARSLDGVERDDVRKIAEAFFELCYDGLGKAPRAIDAEDLRAIVVESLPARFAKKDAAVVHAPAVLEALIEHVAETSVMTSAFEVRRALDAACAELVDVVRSGRNVPEAPASPDPFVHRAAKLGRNDPCSCGSGKKFKKCHGKDA